MSGRSQTIAEFWAERRLREEPPAPDVSPGTRVLVTVEDEPWLSHGEGRIVEIPDGDPGHVHVRLDGGPTIRASTEQLRSP